MHPAIYEGYYPDHKMGVYLFINPEFLNYSYNVQNKDAIWIYPEPRYQCT
jgi:hypothetical protein